jgi:hypothetical protein
MGVQQAYIRLTLYASLLSKSQPAPDAPLQAVLAQLLSG